MQKRCDELISVDGSFQVSASIEKGKLLIVHQIYSPTSFTKFFQVGWSLTEVTKLNKVTKSAQVWLSLVKFDWARSSVFELDQV